MAYENDLEDFKLPYQLQSKTDLEVMELRYKKLIKSTYGYIVRTGIIDKNREIKNPWSN